MIINKILSYEEFKSINRLYIISDKEIKSDYKKLEIQFEYNKLSKKLKSLLKRNKREEARIISAKIEKLLIPKK